MQLKRRTTAWLFAVAWFAWDLVVKPVLTLNVENAAQRNHMDTVLTSGGRMTAYLTAAASYIPSSFGLGFVVGALIFAYWDALAARIPFMRRERVPAIPVQPLGLRAWCGNIHIDTRRAEEENAFQIWIDFINCGDVAFKIGEVSGYVKIHYRSYNGGRKSITLPAPMVSSFSPKLDAIPPLNYTGIVLHQTVGSQQIGIISSSRYNPSLDLRELKIELIPESGESKFLKMWEGVTPKSDLPASEQCSYFSTPKPE